MAKTYCHSLLSGSSWTSFKGCSLQEEPEAMEVDENNGADLTEATRLRREGPMLDALLVCFMIPEMTLFGLCPDQEEVCLISCSECGRVVKASAIARHSEYFHDKVIPRSTTPSPECNTPSPIPGPIQPRIKLPTKLKGPRNSTVQLKDITVKLEEVPLTLPESNHVISASSITEEPLVIPVLKKAASEKATVKKSPRKIIPTREREFDPDKHCGVWVVDQQKRCTRSLTCKTHALSLRRAVPGRSKAFDTLLSEHKARVNSEKEQQGLLLKSQTNSAIHRLAGAPESRVAGSGISSTSREDISKSTVPGNPLSNEAGKGPEGSQRMSTHGGRSGTDRVLLNHHPRPMASCRFGARTVGKGAFVFNRRSDHLRCAVLSMVERCLNPSLQRKKSSRPVILQRPTVKTIGQASNHGLSNLPDKYKHQAATVQNSKILNNFLKAPPLPRNKSLKQVNATNGLRSLESSVDGSSSVLHNFTVTQSKKSFLDTSGGKTHLIQPSNYIQPDASSQAISDMGHIVASIDANVSEKPMNLGNSLNGTCSMPSGLSLDSNVNLDSSLNLCSTLGLNPQGAVVAASRTQFLGSSAPPFASVSGAQLSEMTAISGQVQQNVKGILPASILGKVSVGATALTSSTFYKGTQLAGQLDPSGKIISVTSGQRASPVLCKKATTSLPNGTVASPPPSVGAAKNYPNLNFIVQGNNNVKSNAPVTTAVMVAGLNKGQSLIFNNMGVSQIQPQPQVLIQQPASPMQQPQNRGKVNIRTNTLQKVVQQKSPHSTPQGRMVQSPSPRQPSPGPLSPHQPQSRQSTQYLNHQHMSTSQQPIVQLRQQVEQQHQQLQQQQQQQINIRHQLQQQQQQLQNHHQQQQQQQQILQQPQQQPSQQQQQKHIGSQFIKQLPIQPRLAPAPPAQSLIAQQQTSTQNIVMKVNDPQLKGSPNSIFIPKDSHQNLQSTVVQKPQSNVV